MTSLLLGAIAGVVISIVYYLAIAASDRKRVGTLGAYFFDQWQLKEKTVAISQFSSSMSLATVVIALLQLGVVFGVGLSWATITFCLGWSLFVLLLPAIRNRTVPRDTIHSFLGRRYQSDSVRVVASAATIAGFLGLFSTELFAAYAILDAFGVDTRWSPMIVMAFACGTIAYSAMGGFRSVVRSDWSQSLLLLGALGVLGVLVMRTWAIAGYPAIDSVPQATSWALPLTVAVSLFFINVPYPLVDTQAWQRGRAAATDRDARRGTTTAILLFAATWSSLIFLAVLLSVTVVPGRDPFTEVIHSALSLPPWAAMVVGFIVAPGLAAAMFSSADGFVNSAAHVYSLDLSGLRSRADSDDVRHVARRHVVVLGLGGLSVAMLLKSAGFGIVDMVFAVSAGQLALLPSVGYGLLSSRSESVERLRGPALWSIAIGFAAAWANGLYSVLAAGEPTLAISYLPPDVYRSPAYAVLASGTTFLAGAIFVRWLGVSGGTRAR